MVRKSVGFLFQEIYQNYFFPHVAAAGHHNHQSQVILFSIMRFLGFLKEKLLLSGYEICALKDCFSLRTVRELRQPEDSQQLCLSVLCDSRSPGVLQQMGRTQCHLLLRGGCGGILVLLAEILAQTACTAHLLRGQQCCLLFL